MAEELKQPFDPDATVKQPVAPIDGEDTPTRPVVTLDADPEATFKGPVFDPDATVSPAARAALEDPDATVRIPTPGKRRKKNPFAPHASPEILQANLSALGGLNSLVALANPVLGAVPQIRRALKHPDPAQLRASLRDQIESLETSAMSADIPDKAVAAAVYALCALLDESAASTPWGRDWTEQGLLHELRGATDGGDGFFALLEELAADPDENADLIEFFYVCMALGFEGRFRDAEGGRHELDRLRDRIYALISRRRPRPRDGLSERWRSAQSPQAAPQAGAQLAAGTVSARVSLMRAMPLRSKLSIAAAVAGALIAGFLVSLRLLEDSPALEPAAQAPQQAAQPAPAASTPAPVAAPATPAPAPVASTPAPAPSLAAEIGRDAVLLTEQGAVTLISFKSARQFASGGERPSTELRALIAKVARALDRVPGAIVVAGHADATPMRAGSNQALSLARARAVAELISAGLADPLRVRAVGRGDAEPVVPNDSAANRARNRRVVIELRRGT